MGQKLSKLYEYVDELQGLRGKMELAKRTKIPSTLAASVPDSPETVLLFERAIAEITGKRPPP